MLATVADNRCPSQRLPVDFGCGQGENSVCFGHLGYEVYGFDISEQNIAACRQLTGKYKLNYPIHYSVQTAEQLEFADEFFDFIAGIDILHHVDIRRAIAECMRVLKHGGHAVFREPLESPLFDPVRIPVSSNDCSPRRRHWNTTSQRMKEN